MPYLQSLLNEVGISGLADIAIMALVIYSVLVWLKRTKRAALVLAGIMIVAGIYLVAQQFDLRLTVTVLEGFFAIILVALVVIFQEELRYFFEQIAQIGLKSTSFRKKTERGEHELADTLTRTLTDLAADHVGALVVLRGRDPIVRHLEGGQHLGGQVSEAVLKSLFDPHSIGHDGAVIIENDRIESFGSHLPLSKTSGRLEASGTRHAAALGLSERTDAMCLVVSEERGTISVARHGRLEPVREPARLRDTLEEFRRETAPRKKARRWQEFFKRNYREKLASTILAAALWLVLVHESRIDYRTFSVPVELGQVPHTLSVSDIQPKEVDVTFSAPRKSLYLVKPANIRLTLRAWELAPGTTPIPVTASDLSFPKGLVFETVKPRQVLVVTEHAGTNSSEGR